MIVFIGNLPAEITVKDLVDVAQLAAGTAVRICKKRDSDGGLYRYGLVHLKSDREGRKLIRRLHGTGMSGNSLQAREYGHRRASNERRRLDWRSVPWHGPERRNGERRTPD
ncbi:MAG: RNA-binding protein [Gammaproteobacteria bacterium]|nr:RNA-binding protein [Gammaproteobacteria bacterium]